MARPALKNAKRSYSFRLPPEVAAALKRAAKEREMSAGRLLVEIICKATKTRPPAPIKAEKPSEESVFA